MKRSPFAFFYNLKIGTKILSGYMAALGLAAIVGGLAFYQLNQVNATVTRLTGHLSRERDLAEKMAVQIYRIRLYANQYIFQEQEPTALASYNQALAYAQTLLDEGDQIIIEKNRMDIQAKVRDNFDRFAASFAEIVQLLSARQEMETNVINPQAASSLDKLAVLRNNSFESLNFTSAHYASQARDTFSQMQVNVSQYLATGNEQYASQADADYETIRSTITLLNTSVREQAARLLVNEIGAAVAAYHDGFHNIQSLAVQQRDQISNQLDVYGPAVDQSATDIVNSINQEFAAQSQKTNQLVGRTQFVVLVTIGLVDVVGLAFGVLLSRAVTRQIKQVARAAQGIAAGALDQEVHVQSNDELGILAEAFNHMTAQVRETMAALQTSVGSLQESEERLRLINETLQAIFNVSPLAIVLLDRDDKVQLWNPAAERIFGWTAQEIMGQPNPMVPSERQEEYQSIRQYIVEVGNITSQEIVRQRKDGSLIHVSLSSAALYDSRGKPRARMAIIADVSERKQAEKALHEAKQLYENIFRLSPEVIVVTSEADGRYLAVSEAHERITGYRPDEMIGHSISEFMIWESPTEGDMLVQILRKDGTVHNIETRFYRRSGELYTALVSMARVEVGGEWCIVSIVTDITERKRGEEEVRRLNAELERRVIERTEQLENANKELESFSYSVSHDLRAPLRAIDGFSRILQEDFVSSLPAEASRLIHSVRSNTQHMGRLIDDLLRFSRLNRQPVNKQAVDAAALARQALQMLEPDREGRQVEITSGKLPACQGDPGLLLQVWVNLLSNAIKFTRQREIAHIEIGCQVDERGAQVYFVRDDGVGFDMRYASKLFGVFQRLHPVDKFEGSGVGLALVQRIIQRHGGRIWAEATPDAGATFFFTVDGE
jgi:PAS domain S-box-containing protein